MDNLESKMKKQLTLVAAELGLPENKSVKLESNGQFGFFFRVNLKVS